MTIMSEFDERPSERRFPEAGGERVDAALTFIGRVRSPWRERTECPKNLRQARERGQGATVEIDTAWREALTGLDTGGFVHLLTWLDRAPRDLAVQHPRHAEAPRGTFALRSPVRPNPIGLHLVRIVAIDVEAGRIDIDAVDVLDETPLLDIKPYLASVDAPPLSGAG